MFFRTTATGLLISIESHRGAIQIHCVMLNVDSTLGVGGRGVGGIVVEV